MDYARKIEYYALEVLCSNYAGLKWHFHPTPHGPVLLRNIPGLSFLKELLDNNYSVKHLMSKRKVGNCEAFERLGAEVTRL